MKLKLILGALFIVPLMAEQARASDLSGVGTVPVLINLIILAGAAACLSMAIKLYNLVKGGALAKGWQLFIISFVTLILGQFFALAREARLFAPGFDIAAVLYLATVLLWFFGLSQTRKVLE